MTSLISRKLQAEKRGKMSPFAKGDPVTLVLRIAYDQHRAPNMRALRVSADALSRRVQADLKNAEFVWRPTAQDIRWCSDTQETVEVFWSSRAQSKLQEDLTTTAFGLFEDDMQKLGMNAMVMYQLSGDSREVTRDSFRLWFRYAGKGEPKVALSRLLFTSETNDPGSSRGGRSPSPSMHSPTMALEPMHISPDGGRALGDPRSRKDLHRSPSPNILGRRPEHRRTRSPEVRRSPQAHRRSFSPPPRRGSSSVPHDYSPALGRRVRTPPPARISPPSADDEESFSQGARLIAMGYLLDQVQMRTSVLEEMLSERAQSSADYRARAPKLQKDLAEAEKVLQACEASEGRLRSIAQKVGIGDAQDGDKLDLLRSFELRLRMLKEKVALEEKLQRDAEANLERERDRHNSLLARLERQQQQQQQFMPGYGMSGMHPITGVQPMHGPMGGPLGPQFFGHGGGPPSW